MTRTPAVLFLALLLLAGSSGGTPNPYGTAVLAQPPIMTRTEWVVDLTRFNNWLNENHGTLPEDRVAGPREHAYLLIDSILRDRQSEQRHDFSEIERVGLRTLFNWATRLGVHGAGLVARDFPGDRPDTLEEPLLPTHPFKLNFAFPLFSLTSASSGWRARFPYYFMMFDARRFTSKAGLDTEMVIISTLFAKHRKNEGQSQATITVVFSPTDQAEKFRAEWLELYKLSSDDRRKKSALPQAYNYYRYDKSEDMHKELTFLEAEKGHLLVSYLGRDGTYQANRHDYKVFLKELSYK